MTRAARVTSLALALVLALTPFGGEANLCNEHKQLTVCAKENSVSGGTPVLAFNLTKGDGYIWSADWSLTWRYCDSQDCETNVAGSNGKDPWCYVFQCKSHPPIKIEGQGSYGKLHIGALVAMIATDGRWFELRSCGGDTTLADGQLLLAYWDIDDVGNSGCIPVSVTRTFLCEGPGPASGAESIGSTEALLESSLPLKDTN